MSVGNLLQSTLPHEATFAPLAAACYVVGVGFGLGDLVCVGVVVCCEDVDLSLAGQDRNSARTHRPPKTSHEHGSNIGRIHFICQEPGFSSLPEEPEELRQSRAAF